jgi:hypothetical protein
MYDFRVWAIGENTYLPFLETLRRSTIWGTTLSYHPHGPD